jgi:hypothetical protein
LRGWPGALNGKTRGRKVEEKVIQELEALEKRDGVLYPERVVEFAKNPKSALHEKFCWDDTEAAKQYRIYQARQIIRVTVRMVQLPAHLEPVGVRAFVSLPDDRKVGGGYRSIAKVLSDDDLRQQLLKSAKEELAVFRRKYRDIAELSEVNQAIDKLIVA